MHIQVKLTQKQRDNLFKLAGYLLNLPKNYKHFDMATCRSRVPRKVRVRDWWGEGYKLVEQRGHAYAFTELAGTEINNEKNLTECGAVACALGHCADAGIKPLITCGLIDWKETAGKLFGAYSGTYATYQDIWLWLFSGSWEHTDNTPHGAAMRICWLLANGLPNDAHGQRLGKAPLCYKGIEV